MPPFMKRFSTLGLNICRLIAERLKGKVLLDKEYKEGARFVFVLPVKKSI